MTTQNRQPVLRCVLSNAAHPEYGQVTIPFPIPVMEYERTLELLAAMELGARLKRDCRVDELESGFPILKRLEKVGANLDELDYLPGGWTALTTMRPPSSRLWRSGWVRLI
mgnify:CR=1 FL=1